MQTRIVLTLVMSCALAAAVLAQTATGDRAATGSTPVAMTASDLKWMDLDPAGAPGVQVANLWGDYRKGAFGAFFKLPAGFAAPLHTHTHSMKLVIVSGTYLQAPDGKPEFRLGPGSYLMQPGGNYRHTTRCGAGSECLFFVESDAAFDLHTVSAEKAGAPK